MSKTFKSFGRKRGHRSEYCADRYAQCLEWFCVACSCNDGRLYYEDLDNCIHTGSTTPSATTADRPTTRRATKSSSTATTSTWKNVIDTTESTTSKHTTTTKRASKSASYTPEQRTTPSTSFKSGNSMTSSRVVSTTSVAGDSARGKTTVKPRTTTYPHRGSTTGSQGNKNMIRGGNKSNAGAIAGAIVGVVILIVLVAVFLYLRKRKQKKGAKDVNGKAPLDIQFNDLKSREEVENPSSPDGIYTYADAGTISRPNGSAMNAVGNPTYNHNIPVSEPFYNVLEADQNDSQPVYREVVPEQVYMDPNENRDAGGNQDQQEQPIYRELEEESPAYAPIDQPIYRELEEETPSSPVYADIANSTVDKTGPRSPRQYQELNYAATPNVYQPLDNDWKSQKYNR